MLRIPSVLPVAQVADARAALESAEWTDGKATAGYLSSAVKSNAQVPEGHPVARRLGEMILDALDNNALFISAALPLKVVPPLFNRYAVGQSYGAHVEGAVRPVLGTPHRVRTDLSATLFLTSPDEYDGGQLLIGDSAPVKLAAGDMLLYSSTSVHRVEPVTRGERLASFFWIQSMVRDDAARRLLFEMDTALQKLGRDVPDHESLVALMGTYHNLLRRWADT